MQNRYWGNQYMLLATALCLSVIGCSGPATRPVADGPPLGGPAAYDKIPDAVPRAEPLSRYGNMASYEVYGERYYVLPDSRGYKKRGRASWYGRKFHGRRTSSGEPYDMYAMTAAHKTLPLPTYVKVTNLSNGKQVILRVNDRGPFHNDRIIDLSYSAALKLDMFRNGTAMVEVEALDPAVKPTAAEPVPLQTEVAIKPQPVPSVTPAGDSHLFLQAGAFGNKTNAHQLKQKLLKAGLSNADIYKTPEDRFYRVRLGPYADQAELLEDRKRLMALGISPQPKPAP